MDPKTAQIRSAIAALRAQADVLEATIEADPVAQDDPWFDLESGATYSGLAADTLRSWAQGGVLRACRGERGRIIFRRTWLDSAIESRPYKPPTRRTEATADELDPLESEIASGRLVRGDAA